MKQYASLSAIVIIKLIIMANLIGITSNKWSVTTSMEAPAFVSFDGRGGGDNEKFKAVHNIIYMKGRTPLAFDHTSWQ